MCLKYVSVMALSARDMSFYRRGLELPLAVDTEDSAQVGTQEVDMFI